MNTLPEVIKERSAALVAAGQKYKIDIVNQASATQAGFYLKEANGAIKDLKALKDELLEPHKAAIAMVNGEFREAETTLEGVKTHLKTQLANWDAEQREKARLEQARLDAEAEEAARQTVAALEAEAEQLAEDFEPEKAQELLDAAREVRVPSIALTPVRALPRSVSTYKVYSYRITDEAAIPREYLVVNEKLLGEVARKSKGEAVVAGVEFTVEERVK